MIHSPFFKTNMNILAIDQAKHGGWSVFDYESKQLKHYGSFDFSSSTYTYAKAILEIEKIIPLLIEQYDVSAVFFEDIQMQASVLAFKRLAQMQGVIINLCEKNEYLYDIITPSQWQNYCNARGRSAKEVKAGIKIVETKDKRVSKKLSIQYVKENYNVETNDDNLADAICIGEYVVHNIKIAVSSGDKDTKEK